MTRPVWRPAAVAAAVLVSGCSLFRATHAPLPARYVVGPAYQAGSIWYYPREDAGYDATGLAVVAADRTGATADGEAFDSTMLAAAHQTLPLPSIVRVTELETGRQVLVRVNDRGPESPARVVALSRKAAALLGIAPGAVARVRVQIDEEASRRAADGLPGHDDRLAIAPAPRDLVRSEALAPPPGARVSSRVRTAAAIGPQPSAVGETRLAPLQRRLPETVVEGVAAPGQLWIRAGEFGRMDYARRLRAQLSGLGAQVQRIRDGHVERFRVRAGPFATVAQADTALDQALHSGVTDARIVVE